MSRARKLVLGLAIAGAAACVFLVTVLAGEGLPQASSWAVVLGLPVAVVTAVAALWALVAQQPKARVPSALELPRGVVDRPAELSSVVKALLSSDMTIAGITTGLHGAGGFGKTTLALMVCAHRQVRRRFRGYVHLVTIGRDVRDGEAIAAKVNDLIKLVSGEDATFTDPELAGQRLGILLDTGPRRLLVIDDVWERDQLTPFIHGGRRCARLVTTRVPGLLAERYTAVRVDQMSSAQARSLLTAGLPTLDSSVTDQLLALTGRWPLLLRLVNKTLAKAAQAGANVPALGDQLLQRLKADGPAAVDDISGETKADLKVGQPLERARAVRATIEASTSLLDLNDAQRFTELGMFAAGETIPFNLAARLWRATGDLDELQASKLCGRLSELALLSAGDGRNGGVYLHDVVRDFLRGELGNQRLAELNDTLLAAISAHLPLADPLGAAPSEMPKVAWWKLDRDDRYLWDHLIEHLLEAGRRSEADQLAGDMRWVGARLHRFGSAAPAADLSHVGTPNALRLRAALTRAAHLLAPTEPTEAVVDILHSRVADHPDWRAQIAALRDQCHWPRLVNRWPLPDLPSSALRRVLTGHTGGVTAVAIAPDGGWLASGSDDGTVRLWDAATGQQQAVLIGHTRWVSAVAIAPDGSWLATSSSDRTVRLWDVATEQQRAVLTWRQHAAHTDDWVGAVAIAPDGSWLATSSSDGMVRLWDAATGQQQAVLTGHTRWVSAVAIAPDGSWLASASADGTLRIWDAVTGQQQALLTDTGAVRGLAIAPDGSWLATGSSDRTVRIWDTVTGQQQVTLLGHAGGVLAVGIAPDGSWLATGSSDGTLRIWDTATEQQRAIPTTHTRGILAVGTTSDGSWLATGSSDGTVRIWDASTGQHRTLLSKIGEVLALAIAPDGSWLATGSYDGTVRIWDTATGQRHATLTGHVLRVNAVAIAPDGSWLATGSSDATVRIWDAATRQQRVILTYTGGVLALAIAPDGSWLATGSYDGTVRIWDASTGQHRTLLSDIGGVLALAIAPDGSWLATGSSDGMVRIWDASTGQQRAILVGRGLRVNAVAIAPDGSWLATGSSDRTVRIWDAATGRIQALMRVEDTILVCSWTGTEGLAIGGPAGLYLFDFTPGAAHGHGADIARRHVITPGMPKGAGYM